MQKQQAVNSERSSYPAPNDSKVSIHDIYDEAGGGAGLGCCRLWTKSRIVGF